MLDHEVEGLLVDPGDAGGLAAALRRMVEDRELRAACIAHAHCRLRAFDVGTLADEYVELYRRLLSSPLVPDSRRQSRALQSPHR
jgi:glycosyltransferase involved in cell wall biosynthesis